MTNKPGEANFFPDVPQFPSMGTFHPVYGKFDLTTYIQGASDYEIMAFLVGKYNACLESYDNITQLSTDTITACEQLQDWINSWFDNLDVQEELNNKIDSMVADGSFGTLLHQTLDTQINQQTTNAVTAWLVANVTPTGSAVVVDKSLSIEGAAADAKATGTKLNLLDEDIKMVNNTIRVNNVLADACLGFVNPEGLNARKDGNNIIVTVAENHGYAFNIPMKLKHKYILSLTLYDKMYLVIGGLKLSDGTYKRGESYYESALYAKGNTTLEIIPTIENAYLYLYVGNSNPRENYTEMSVALYDVTGITDLSGLDFASLKRALFITVNGLVPELRQYLNKIATYGNIFDVIRNSTVGEFYKNPTDTTWNKNGSTVTSSLPTPSGCTIDKMLVKGKKYRIVWKFLNLTHYISFGGINSEQITTEHYKSDILCAKNTVYFLDITPSQDSYLYFYITGTDGLEMNISVYDITNANELPLKTVDFSSFSAEYTDILLNGALVECAYNLNKIATYGNIVDVIRNSTIGEFYKNPTDTTWNKNGSTVTSSLPTPSGCTIDKMLVKGKKYRIVWKFLNLTHYISFGGINSEQITTEHYKSDILCAKNTVYFLDITPSQDSYLYFYITGTDGLEMNISVYDITNANELPLKTVDFSSFSAEYTDILLNGALVEYAYKSIGNWYGKKLTTFGDSNVDNERWQPYLISKYNFSHTNCGVGGSTVSDNTNGMCTDKRVNAIPADTDLLIFLGGTNDWGKSVPLGEKTLNNTDTSTFYGALNVMFNKIVARVPKARLFALGTGVAMLLVYDTSWADGKHNALGLTTKDYNDAVGEVASWYGIPFGNVFSNSGINWINIASFIVNDGNYIHFDTKNGGQRIAECANAMLKSYEPFNNDDN